ncbi:MAG TPA: hypothetical protein VG452_13240 [Egibacteraceae bacterium]|nr:hypothetical protein [Actinomycetota bacterium]HWB73174.1 hypothetical protein [Egibacteraceae bacterium]
MSASDDHQTGRRGYLEHLTDDDLAVLARAGGVEPADPGRALARLRADPRLVEELLARRDTYLAVLGPPGEHDPFLRVSPFLVFAVAVHRTFDDLGRATFVQEWAGARQRLPVFGTDELRSFLAEPLRRLFLTELLGSYTHVASGSLWVQTPRGWRRHRFSELDLVRLASLLEVLPAEEHAGVYRRLGDLALFLTGVFPDHTASRTFRQIDVHRLSRAADAAGREALADALAASGTVGLLEQLGARWYRLAARALSGPATGAVQVVDDVAERFGDARRVLNHLTDRYLFPFRADWFPAPER